MNNWIGWENGCWLGWGDSSPVPPVPDYGGGMMYRIAPPKKIEYDSDEDFLMAWMMFMQAPYKLEK